MLSTVLQVCHFTNRPSIKWSADLKAHLCRVAVRDGPDIMGTWDPAENAIVGVGERNPVQMTYVGSIDLMSSTGFPDFQYLSVYDISFLVFSQLRTCTHDNHINGRLLSFTGSWKPPNFLGQQLK